MKDHYKIKNGKEITALDNQKPPGDSLTPRHPFSMMIAGQKSMGKSTLLLNLLLSTDLLAGMFNKIIFFSPTVRLDSKMQKLKDTPGLTFKNKALEKELKKLKKKKKLMDTSEMEFDPDAGDRNIEFVEDVSLEDLKSLCDYQETIIEIFEKKIADRILLVFDDLAGNKKLWNNQQFIKMLFNSRHYNLSLIITTQAYNQIPKPIRLNNSLLVLFEINNVKELENIYSENKCKYTFKQFETICIKVFETPYNILIWNRQNKSSKALQLGFTNYIADIYKDGSGDFERTTRPAHRPLLY